MPNWWLHWAERLAVVLAEAWLRARPPAGDPPAPAPPGPGPAAPPPPSAPEADPRPR